MFIKLLIFIDFSIPKIIRDGQPDVQRGLKYFHFRVFIDFHKL